MKPKLTMGVDSPQWTYTHPVNEWATRNFGGYAVRRFEIIDEGVLRLHVVPKGPIKVGDDGWIVTEERIVTVSEMPDLSWLDQ